jgi:hypothetical protein
MENTNSRPMAELGLEYVDSEWPHGLMCGECPHVFREGERYTTSLYAFSDDVPMCLVLCVPCSTGALQTRGSGWALPPPPA